MSTRRSFIRQAAIGAAGIYVAGSGCAAVERMIKRDPYADLRSSVYFGAMSVETRIDGDGVFLEGPAVAPDGRVFFTDVPNSRIHVWNPRFQELSLFKDSSRMANGLMFDTQRRLVVCEGESGSISRLDVDSGVRNVLVDAFQGNPLEAPNDLFVDGAGRVYFSSRPGPAASKGYINAVYRLDPNGSLHQLLTWEEPQRPNGIVGSPDGSTMYLIMAGGAADAERCIKAFDVDDSGDLSNERVHYDFYPGRSGDGMCIDARGNLYVAAGLHATRGTSETLDTRPGIHVIAPDGMLVAYRETPIDTVTNCTFGGADLKTLFITCGNLLLSVPMDNAGAAFYRPGA